MRSALVLVAACAGGPHAAPTPAPEPAAEALCVTKGAITRGRVTEPTVRAVVPGSGGERASLAFRFHGNTEEVRALASGQDRRQLGLKLRAANGCNLIYVMWRLDLDPTKLEISVKLNPGARTHADCGARGYAKLKAEESHTPPELAAEASHTLRAAITGDELTAWIDDQVMWRGGLPAAARALAGPAGVRSDNVAYDILELATPGHATAHEPGRCHGEDAD